MQRIHQAWAGIDAGKTHHHVVVIDVEGRQLVSKRVGNDEASLTALLDEVGSRANARTWAVDLADGPAALVIALLLQRGDPVYYLPGVAVNRVSGAYRGEGKTDARDAAVIADQARMRRDLRELKIEDELFVELRFLTAHRADLAADRTRCINRLRALLLGVSPSLERLLDFTNHGPVVLISGFPTPHAISDAGPAELSRWLRSRHVRSADKLARSALEAAESQHAHLPGEAAAAALIPGLAHALLELNTQLGELDKMINGKFKTHRHAKIITSMVGIGDVLGAEFLAATGDVTARFVSADHLAGYAGLAPTPRDSGTRSGNLHRPKRYNRQLQRVFYTSAMISIQHSAASRAFYDRKRAQGKRHTQAVIALARRRVNVLWAMIRDNQPYNETTLPATTAA